MSAVDGRLRLSLACGRYDINQALIDGSVQPQGTQLTVLTSASPERHRRMSRGLEFDICEFSLATAIALHGRESFPVVGIPAFPHRRFRHGYLFVRRDSKLRDARELSGARIGLRTWETTAGLWLRGLLQDDYGVDLTSIDWVTQDEEDMPLAHPDRFRMRRAPEGNTVTTMLERGDLDALIYPEVPRGAVGSGATLRPLFTDPKATEIDYLARTGFFPIMHSVVIRRELVDANPWLPMNVLQAFRASRDLAFERMRDPRWISLAWFREAMDEQRRLLGDDPWSYAFAPNRAQIETMIRWSHEQGLIDAPFPPEDLFARSTLEDPPAYV